MYIIIEDDIKKITRLADIANLKFFINKITKPHPNKNNIKGILFPVNSIAVACSTITKINNDLLNFLFLNISKI